MTPAAELFRALYDEDLIGWTMLHYVTDAGAFPGEAVRLGDLEAVDRYVDRYRHRDAYFRVYPLAEPPAKGRGLEVDTAYATVLAADYDWQSEKHPGAPPEEEVRAAVEACPLPPSIVVETGNGLQTYHLLTEPVAPETAKGLLARLSDLVGLHNDRSDMASVLRLPGTYNRGTEVRLVKCEPGLTYSVGDLDETLPPLRRPVRIDDGLEAATSAEVEAFLDRYTENRYPGALVALVRSVPETVQRKGGARHPSLRLIYWQALREARAGAYPARSAIDEVTEEWRKFLKDGEKRPKNETGELLRWQVARVEALPEVEVEKVAERLAEVFKPQVEGEGEAEEEGGRRRSAATVLVDLAEERYRFVQADDGRPFAVPLHGSSIARPLDGTRSSLRTELAALFAEERGTVPSRSALVDALAVLEGRAATSERERLHLRCAHLEDRIVVDLGDPSGRCAVVTADGWHLEDRAPCLFRRTELTAALPEPAVEGDLGELRRIVNVTADDLPLLVAWLVAVLFEVPRPLLFLTGEQGTGKSVAARTVSQLLDPTPAPLRAAPRDLDGWVVAAAGSLIVALDNLSTIPEWLSDALCRAATGEGLVRRALYTDDGLAVLSFRRAVILTSIDAGALRGDLGERLVPVELERITPDRRRTDADLAATFTELHARLLGAVFDLAARVLEVLPTVTVDDAPRMADFARILAAIDEVTGWASLDAYRTAVDQVAADVVAGDPLAVAVLDFVEARGGTWTGTPTELHTALRDRRPEHGAWPKTPKSLSGALTRLAPALRGAGVEVDRNRSNNARTLTLRATEGDARDARDARSSVALERSEEREGPQERKASSSGASLASPASPRAPHRTRATLTDEDIW